MPAFPGRWDLCRDAWAPRMPWQTCDLPRAEEEVGEEELEEEVEEPGEEEEEEEPAELGREGSTVTQQRVAVFSREEGSNNNRYIWKQELLQGVQRVGVLREVVEWTEH